MNDTYYDSLSQARQAADAYARGLRSVYGGVYRIVGPLRPAAGRYYHVVRVPENTAAPRQRVSGRFIFGVHPRHIPSAAVGEAMLERLVQRVNRVVSNRIADEGLYEDEGEAMFGWLRDWWRGRQALPPTPPPSESIPPTLRSPQTPPAPPPSDNIAIPLTRRKPPRQRPQLPAEPGLPPTLRSPR